MAKKRTKRPKSRIHLEVMWRVDGTTKRDLYTADGAYVTMQPHCTLLDLFDGADANGPVNTVMYQDVARIVRRPTNE